MKSSYRSEPQQQVDVKELLRQHQTQSDTIQGLIRVLDRQLEDIEWLQDRHVQHLETIQNLRMEISYLKDKEFSG